MSLEKAKELFKAALGVCLFFFFCFIFWPIDRWARIENSYGIVQGYKSQPTKYGNVVHYIVELQDGGTAEFRSNSKVFLASGDRVELSVFIHKRNKSRKKYGFVGAE